MPCKGCFEKQRKIDKLEDELQRTKQELYRYKKKIKDGYFGSSTPSSQKPFKENTAHKEKKNGGAVKGHKGHGRRKFSKDQIDDKKKYRVGHDNCKICNSPLEHKGYKLRTVIDGIIEKIKRLEYLIEKKYCPKCNKFFYGKIDVLPKLLVGNQLLAHCLCMHYVYGITVGKIRQILGKKAEGINWHTLFHKAAVIFEPVMENLKQEYRQSKVRHADETGWRTDGKKGYCWGFTNSQISIFQFKQTRSGKIARDIFGKKPVKGYLIVDRYNGYNKLSVKIQYCFEHLKRNIQDFGESVPDNKEVQCFINTVIPLLKEAIKLRKRYKTKKAYYKRAKEIKQELMMNMNKPSKHFGIKKWQEFFLKNEHRLYHWVEDKDVPADNNYAERELRLVVISRKVSFGSQSIKGAETRSILMSVLHTVKKRLKEKTIEEWLKETLDKIAYNPSVDVCSLIPKLDSS